MKLRALIFTDYDLDILLSKRKNISFSKKSLITYFITLPRLNDLIDILFLPESLLDEDNFVNSISSLLEKLQIKVGITINTRILKNEDETPLSQDYFFNPLPFIQNYCEKYNVTHIFFSLPFGKRRIQRSPKYDEYSLHSQFNWTNCAVTLQWILNNKKELWIEPNVYFFENSSEDFYIHMRQILFEGGEVFRKMGFKLNQVKLVIPPFYPKLKGLRDADILDPGNIANTTLRCITECLTKEKMDLFVRPCKEMTLTSFMKYIKFIKTYGKEIAMDYILTADCLKEYIKNWDFMENNLEEAQKKLHNELS